MKLIIVSLLIAAGFVGSLHAAEEMPGPTALKSDQERIDYLIKQNQMLIEVIKSLKAESDRPKTKEEAFAACMQAAKGATNPMSAESIGGHCDQLLKKS
jgi:hypothetical protein